MFPLLTRPSCNIPSSQLTRPLHQFRICVVRSSPQSRYMFDIKELFLIDMLKVIPGETQVDLLTIAIDLPESR